jgi:hypothetical protein
MRTNGNDNCAIKERGAGGAVRENRRQERRQERWQLSCFQWHEKRSGFDKRRQTRRSGPAAMLEWPRRLARVMHEKPGLLIKVLFLFNLYNLADFILTNNALAAGHYELNPVMRALFALDPLLAFIFKITIGLTVTAVIWHYRRFRLMLQFSLLICGLYLLVLAYHFYGVIFFA